MLQARGLPPTLSLLAESLLDGRLPPRSIAWLKIQTIAVNIREDYIKRWRFPEEIYQMISQALTLRHSSSPRIEKSRGAGEGHFKKQRL